MTPSPAQTLAQAEDWTGYSGVGEYANANGNTFDVVTAGHRNSILEPQRAVGQLLDQVLRT